MSHEYAIETRRFQARVRMVHDLPRDLELFLAPDPRRHTGFERPSDLFNHPGRFLPALDPEQGLVFLARRAVAALEVPPELELDEDELALEACTSAKAATTPVEVHFQDGSTLQGTVRWVLPEGHNRVQDFLELEDGFFTVRGTDSVYIVNKESILLVGSPQR